MRKRLLFLLPLFGLVLAPAAARCQDKKDAKPDTGPSLVVQVRSIDGLMEDAKYLMTLVGQEEQAKQMDGLLKSMGGKEGIKGIDAKRPFGFYGTVGKNFTDSTGVALIPIADEKAFVAWLDGMNLNLKKGEDGIYSFTAPNIAIEAYLRFANQYAYIAPVNKEALAKEKLLPPASVLAGKASAAFAVTIRFDRLPTEVKQLFVQQMELQLNAEMEKKEEGETETQHKFRKAALKDIAQRTNRVLSEGRSLTLRLNLDRKSDELFIDLALAGLPGSQLATNIAELRKMKSLFADALGADSAMNVLVHLALPAELRTLWGTMIEEELTKALDKEKNKEMRDQIEPFLREVARSSKAGEMDSAFSVRGPGKEGKYAFLLAFKVKDGEQLDKTGRDMVKKLKKEERERIVFDADKVGAVPIHKLDIKKDLDEDAKQLFGDSPLYVAVRPDAVFFVFGEGGLEALKQAVAAKAGPAPQMQFEIALNRFAKAMAEKDKAASQAAKAAFDKSVEGDRIRFVIEGGKALEVRFSVKAPVIKFFAEVTKAKMAGQ